jgi:hypothetical protein
LIKRKASVTNWKFGDAPIAFLEIPCLVDDQHRGGVAEVVDQVFRMSSRTACSSQTAPASRCYMPSGVAWPACSAIVQQFFRGQVSQQPTHERPGVSSRLHPAKPARDPTHQLLQPHLPPGRRNAVAGGHRLVFGCPHTTGSSTVTASSIGRSSAALTSQVTTFHRNIRS